MTFQVCNIHTCFLQDLAKVYPTVSQYVASTLSGAVGGYDVGYRADWYLLGSWDIGIAGRLMMLYLLDRSPDLLDSKILEGSQDSCSLTKPLVERIKIHCSGRHSEIQHEGQGDKGGVPETIYQVYRFLLRLKTPSTSQGCSTHVALPVSL